MLPEMKNKDADIVSVAEKALKDRELLSEILAGLKSKNETLRYNCSKVLTLISEENGDVLYPNWDYFLELLISGNTYRKLSATLIIANLTRFDREGRFEKIFGKYYGILDDKSMIAAIYIASSSGKIIRWKPELETRITDKLLNIDKTHHEEGRKALIKAGAIEAFNEYFAEIKDKDRIIEFVKEQQDSESPKARKLAREFLKKWGSI